MSTLAMVLAAALLAGNAPEKVSGEVEQRLDLRGEWEGTRGDAFTPKGGIRVEAMKFDGFLVHDEGKGKVTLENDDPRLFPGIYRQDGDRLVICLGMIGQNRPTSFRPGKGQLLYTLYRIKPGK